MNGLILGIIIGAIGVMVLGITGETFSPYVQEVRLVVDNFTTFFN